MHATLPTRIRDGLACLLLLLISATALAQTTYTLTLYRQGTGTGTVTSSPAGINCGTACSASFASGTSVILTAARPRAPSCKAGPAAPASAAPPAPSR